MKLLGKAHRHAGFAIEQVAEPAGGDTEQFGQEGLQKRQDKEILISRRIVFRSLLYLKSFTSNKIQNGTSD